MNSKPLLLETIRLEGGKLSAVAYHQERLEKSLAFYYGQAPIIDLEREIAIPEAYRTGLFKVRVLYGAEIKKIEFQAYHLRPVHALQMVRIGQLDYAHKYADRQALQRLDLHRTYGDDILMIRNGLLTDTSYANVALFDGDKWFTPARPLLAGTARARYLDMGILHPVDIHYTELGRFSALKIINAMIEWEKGASISLDRIRW